jgi:CRP/FNR family cyclic AMP-dependent transcriptional regulator
MPLILDPAAFQTRLAALPVATYQVGETVLSAGTTSGRLLVLKTGAVEVMKDGMQIAEVSEPGAVFGELSMLLDQPHAADVRALEVTEFHVADAASLLTDDPATLLYVTVLLARRLSTNRALIEVKRQIQAGQPRSMVSRTVEKAEELLNYGGGEKSIDAGVRICGPEGVVCPHVVVTVKVLIGQIGAVAEGAVVLNSIVAERRDHDDSFVAVAEGAVVADQVVVREDTDAVANCIDREVGVDPVAGAAELNPLIDRARDLIASDLVGSAAHLNPFGNPTDHVIHNLVLDPVDADATLAATDRVPHHMVAGTIDPDRIGAAEQHPVAD